MKNEMKFQYETLDKIDFLPFIKKYKHKKFIEMIRDIEKTYDHTDICDNDVLEGFIFNWISEYELAEYLKKRYKENFKVYEVSYYILV